MHTRHVNFPMLTELAAVAAAPTSFIFRLAIFQGQFYLPKFIIILYRTHRVCMRKHRQTGPRDVYANLLLFIDSRVPDENHLPPRSDRRVAQFIVVIIIVDPPQLCIVIKIYATRIRLVNSKCRINAHAPVLVCVLECTYIFIASFTTRR